MEYSAQNQAPALILNNISKSFGAVRAVEGISAEIPNGYIYGFLGPNGAGKTTTIRMIMNIIYPDSGEVRIFGAPAGALMQDRIGYLPEERGLYRKMQVGKALAFLGRLKGMSAAALRRKIPAALEEVGLGDTIRRKVEELSKGNQQKLQFVATVLHDPQLVILDEPFSGLDPLNLELITQKMIEMRAAGKTIIFSTHGMDQAQKLCDSILLINQGRKIVDGPLREILMRYRTNAVDLEIDENAEFIRALPFVAGIENHTRRCTVTLRDGVDSQELLAALAGRVRIRLFEEKLPTLHEIFVKLVGASNTTAANMTAENGAMAGGHHE